MGLVLNYSQERDGRWTYRRRVPKDVLPVVGKREFKKLLGETKREALRQYPQVHAAFEREIAEARQALAVEAASGRGELTEREAYNLAAARADELAGDNDEVRDIAADSLLSRYRQNAETGDPEGVPDVDRLTAIILRNRGAPPPTPTLEDAKRLYLKDRYAGGEGDQRRDAQRVHKAFREVKAALGTLPPLTELKRDDARKVRDHLLTLRKSDGGRLSSASARRLLTVVKAAVNHALREYDLVGTVGNPFNSLPVEMGGDKAGLAEREKRLPLPPKVLGAVRDRVLSGGNRELGLIWRLLEGTGCRLAEITGLRVEDLDVAGELPNIQVRWHEERRIKTDASKRHVPLVGDALTAAKEALELAGEAHLLFARYGRARGADAASAALMKHLRLVTTDPRYVVHSLRHNMKDALVVAEVNSLDQNLILGHALGNVGDRVYGGEVAKLRATTRALEKVANATEGSGHLKGK